MPSTRLPLINQLAHDYPAFQFTAGNDFQWSASIKTILYNPSVADWELLLLHELSHAILDHHTYQHDIGLVAMERDAWDYAKTMLANHYNLAFSNDLAEDNLDSYREWLHARSTCPGCTATGLQIDQSRYRCLLCDCLWRVNEARTCSLRRRVSTS